MTEQVEDLKPELLQLVPEDSPILKQVLPEFTFPNADAWQIVTNLVRTMEEHNGLGLSANQVGLDARVFVMRGKPPMACFNPRIVDVSEEEVLLEEGCLSFPGLYVKVKRPMHIKVRYQDADGETHTEKMTGMSARVFQHELDHMNGARFIDRANRFHRDQAYRKRNK